MMSSYDAPDRSEELHFYAEYLALPIDTKRLMVLAVLPIKPLPLSVKIDSALNRAFAEWREVFPNATCVVSLVDRLVHNSEVLAIEGESYRLKEARERAERRVRQPRKAKA
jgi:IstB-like ATP binding protein